MHWVSIQLTVNRPAKGRAGMKIVQKQINPSNYQNQSKS